MKSTRGILRLLTPSKSSIVNRLFRDTVTGFTSSSSLSLDWVELDAAAGGKLAGFGEGFDAAESLEGAAELFELLFKGAASDVDDTFVAAGAGFVSFFCSISVTFFVASSNALRKFAILDAVSLAFAAFLWRASFCAKVGSFFPDRLSSFDESGTGTACVFTVVSAFSAVVETGTVDPVDNGALALSEDCDNDSFFESCSDISFGDTRTHLVTAEGKKMNLLYERRKLFHVKKLHLLLVPLVVFSDVLGIFHHPSMKLHLDFVCSDAVLQLFVVDVN